MPKHRSPGFAVVREIAIVVQEFPAWAFHGIVGVYATVQRAEEVASATIQKYIDMGMNVNSPEFRCKVQPTNWYDE